MKRFLLSISIAAGLMVGCSDSKPADKPADKPAGAKPADKPADKPAETKPAAAPAAGDATAQAKNIFQTRCTVCHGASGKGDGATAATLNPKPRDYTDAEWQKSVTDEQLAKTIVEGGAAVGKSPLMPGNPDLKDKPEVVKEIVQIIRGFGGGAAAEGGDKPAEEKKEG